MTWYICYGINSKSVGFCFNSFKAIGWYGFVFAKKKKRKERKLPTSNSWGSYCECGNIEQMVIKFDVYSFGFVIAELLNNRMEFYLGYGISDGVFACMF